MAGPIVPPSTGLWPGVCASSPAGKASRSSATNTGWARGHSKGSFAGSTRWLQAARTGATRIAQRAWGRDGAAPRSVVARRAWANWQDGRGRRASAPRPARTARCLQFDGGRPNGQASCSVFGQYRTPNDALMSADPRRAIVRIRLRYAEMSQSVTRIGQQAVGKSPTNLSSDRPPTCRQIAHQPIGRSATD
jgi:hypothetical protein